MVVRSVRPEMHAGTRARTRFNTEQRKNVASNHARQRQGVSLESRRHLRGRPVPYITKDDATVGPAQPTVLTPAIVLGPISSTTRVDRAARSGTFRLSFESERRRPLIPHINNS